MKVLWEADDIRAGMRAFQSNSKTGEGVMVGYIPGDRVAQQYCIISLDDGLVIAQGYTFSRIAQWLNDGACYIPEEINNRRKSQC